MKKADRETVMYIQASRHIKNIARKMSKGCGHNEGDLFSAGIGTFPKAVKTWDTDRASFATWWRRLAKNAMIDYIRKTDVPLSHEAIMHAVQAYNKPEDDDPMCLLRDTSATPDMVAIAADTFRNLSEEAMLVASIVLHGPSEILEMSDHAKPKAVRGAIVKWLREHTDWSWSTIWKTFHELKETYS